MLAQSKTSVKSVTCLERQTIHNLRHTENFTVIGNDLLQDFTLSAQAHRILTYLLSLPKDWKIYQSHIMKVTGKKRRTVQSYMTELRNAGYVTYTRLKKFNRNDPSADQGYYRVYEKPHNQPDDDDHMVVDCRDSANDEPDNPVPEKNAPQKTEKPVVDADKELQALISDLKKAHPVSVDDENFLRRKSNHWFSTLTCKFRADHYFNYMERGFKFRMRQQVRSMKTENVKDQKNNELNALIQAQADKLKSQASQTRSSFEMNGKTLEDQMDRSWNIDPQYTDGEFQDYENF